MDRLALPLRAALILLAGLAAAAACTAAVAQPADERLAAHAKLRTALEAGRLEEAAAQAATVVSLTEARFGAESRELVNPLTNAGTVAFRRGDLATAETAYRRAVALIEGKAAGADRDLMRPLVGLGETWLAAGRPAEAVVVLKRAVDLSRNLDGLYNLAQLDIVDPLLEGYAAIGAEAEADREHQFAFRVAESAYGRNDPRLLDPLDRLARWRESQLRFGTARGLHARALQIAEQTAQTAPLAGVPAMRGLSRNWMGEAVYGPEVTETMAPEMTGGVSDPFPAQAGGGRLNPDGERVLRYAVELVRATAPVDQTLLGETLAQLGDWHLLAGAGNKATAAYAEAWRALVAAGAGKKDLLERPRQLIYRPPPTAASRLAPSDPDQYTVRDVELLLRIGRDGKVLDARLPDGSEPDPVVRSLMFAARKARYAPRIEAGLPVEADGVVFRERMLVKASRE
jgi:tetratricopeptide (TPR) repeat protein